VRKRGNKHATLSRTETDAVLAELDTVLAVSNAGQSLKLLERAGGLTVGEIAVNRSRITLRDLQLPLSTSVEVENTDYQIGQDPNRVSLRRYLNREERFIVLFDVVSYAYIDGTLFRDDALTDGGAVFLRHLRADPLLANVVSEKGAFTPAHVAFDANSTFGVVEASVAEGDEILVCDDLGNEWADFIGMTNTSIRRV
jgi:hypothetical protein